MTGKGPLRNMASMKKGCFIDDLIRPSVRPDRVSDKWIRIDQVGSLKEDLTETGQGGEDALP